MARVAQLWQIQVWDEAAFLAFAQRAEAVRRRYGLRDQVVLKTGTTPRDYTVLLLWEDEDGYARWRASAERRQIQEEGSHLRVGEPRRLYRVVLESH